MAGASRSPVSVGRWWQVALLLSAIVAGGHARESYNILFIVVDDLKPTLGVYGDGVADTPNMDSLLNRGVRFENMNCQKPECAPSRASMISGKRNDALKLWDFSPVFRKNNLNLMTWPGHLRHELGYTTVGLGKILDNRNFNGDSSKSPDLCFQDGNDGVRCSWDEYLHTNTMYTVDGYCGDKHALRWPTEEAGFDEDDKQQHLIMEFDEEYRERHIDACIRIVAQRRLKELAAAEEPFLLAVGFAKPHMPWTAPREDFLHFRKMPDSLFTAPPELDASLAENDFWTDHSSAWTKVSANGEMEGYDDFASFDDSDRARAYYASTRFVDHQVGYLMDTLDNEVDEAVRDRTLIILWGDHGFHLGEYGLWGKKTVLEHATRVPCGVVLPPAFLALPGNEAYAAVANTGAFSMSPIDSVDFYPTLLELVDVGAPADPSRLAGASLMPVMRDTSAFIRSASISQYESYKDGSFMGYSIRTMHHRLIVYMKLNKKKGTIAKKSAQRMELYRYLQPGNYETINYIDDPAFADVKTAMLAIVSAQSDKDWVHVLGQTPFDALSDA